ncbi:hypothetical protein VTL71DRAFT_3945 [Oculimacula yallundae]|uniref:Uncharacterized protein n=1 Tax=Oculimacula yallundae TaxID=86028 RepID=A0ABR4C4G3_9HELO
MASIPPPIGIRAASHDKGHPGDAPSTRPRASSERDMRTSMSNQRPDENCSPANFSRACEGMLKTTTETGDIGMFSIKPSRVPQSLGTPRRPGPGYNPEIGHQKPRQTFQPYGVPVVDDRRRLPSYARDAASEVISMYESASQKSASRVFDEPDYRSYSMTQTSYSSYTLSNHRSYNSLRSQADPNTQVQRPRSPFAYPARLKRPGFRPSSPALTDGGIVDYSRRAEIERIHPGGGSHSTSSPSSLYAHRRRPHQSLRPEGNRSTPSLLSQSSPPRRSSSPLVSRNHGSSSHDWARRPGPASVNTSPARSTFSLASTVNLYTSAQPPSTTTTPGKVPPSPRYYDYTEDFEMQVYSESAAVDPPPPFRIDRTIPEDRPVSSDRPLTKDGPDSGYDSFQVPSLERSNSLRFRNDRKAAQNIPNTKEEPLAVESTETGTEPKSSVDHGNLPQDRRSIRLSRLGYGAQQLGSHVDEAFGNFPSSALEITNINELEHGTAKASRGIDLLSETLENGKELPSARSSYSVITSIPKFPSPPYEADTPQSITAVKTAPNIDSVPPSLTSSGSEDSVKNLSVPRHPSLMKEHQGIDTSHIDILKSLPEIVKSKRTSASNLYGLVAIEPVEHIDATESLNRKQSTQDDHHPGQSSVRRTPMTSPTVPSVFKLRKTDPEQFSSSPMPLYNRRKATDGQTVPQIKPLNRSQYHGSRRVDLGKLDQEGSNIPNFSHQIPKKEMARSESPMLAPKPISPARQLKLKNSVPQLMKALPPLPPEPSSRPGSPTSSPEAEEVELPCDFSPIDRNMGTSNISNRVKPEMPIKVVSPNLQKSVKIDEKEEIKVAEVFPTTVAAGRILTSSGDTEISLPPPRMKLKMKSSLSQRPTSPPESRPWNLTENYPWSSQTPSIRLPSVVPDLPAPISKPPRFKLKITRASNSTQGTVRVYRDSADSKPMAGLHLRNPKDLFAPSTGIDNIFRHVSRHLHSRRASLASSYASHNDGKLPSSLISNSPSAAYPSTTHPSFTQLPFVPANPLNNSDTPSVFSDDSSHINGNHHLHLRGRISNLKAKIAAPYTNKAGTQSHDDITWRDRQGADASIPAAARSIPDLHSTRQSADSLRPMHRWVEKVRRQKLKTKVQVRGWLREAKSVIVTRVRTRSTAGEGEN